jgi:hypothetical protein
MIVPDQNPESMNTTEGPPRRFEEGRTARRLFLWLGSAGAVLATALIPGWANLMCLRWRSFRHLPPQ